MNTIKEELAKVIRTSDYKYNFIDAQGKLLSDKWFEWAGDFYHGFAIVGRANHEYNFIDTKGKILSDEWFKWLDFFKGEFARVQRKGGSMNFINKDGKIISDEWFSYVDYFDEYGLAVVERTNGEYFKIDKTGKIVVRK